MNVKMQNARGVARLTGDIRMRPIGAPSRSRLTSRVVLGLLLLSAVGCAPTPTVVSVDRPIYLPPPSACLDPVEWDADAEPETNGDLWASWLRRAWALDLAISQLDCLRDWSDEMRERFPASPEKATGR